MPQYADISTNRTAPLSPLIIISQRLTTSLINSSQELQKQNYDSQCNQASWNHHLPIRSIIFMLQRTHFLFWTGKGGNLCFESCFKFRFRDFGSTSLTTSKAWSPFTSWCWVLGKDSSLPYFIILFWDPWGHLWASSKRFIKLFIWRISCRHMICWSLLLGNMAYCHGIPAEIFELTIPKLLLKFFSLFLDSPEITVVSLRKLFWLIIAMRFIWCSLLILPISAAWP